jgi:hypothetical protein
MNSRMNRRRSIGVIFAGICGVRTLWASRIGLRQASESHSISPNDQDELRYVDPAELRPDGWLREQMYRDLEIGFAGHLGQLCSEVSSDIFGKNRNGATRQNLKNHDGINWWNGESEGNWRAGFLQMAVLSRHAGAMREANDYVRHILASQDSDGYIGAFAPEVRYQFEGELWTQACILRGLLAYSELQRDHKVRQAVIRAVNCTMTNYKSGRGVWPTAQVHDLMFSDVVERLFQLTGDTRYPTFSLWLYERWSDVHRENDTSLPALLRPDARFVQHGVRTYESIRLPLWLSTTTGRADLRQAAARALSLLDKYRELSGGEVSGELIRDLQPDPTRTECEYCAMKEVQATLIAALQMSGDPAFADRVEEIWFNAAQGARLADGRALTYLTQDNRLRCDGFATDSVSLEPRNKFSPTNADVAVCCNPNAANVAALFVRSMWMRRGDNQLTAMLYGPCEFDTKVGETRLHIRQDTHYPFENTVRFVVTCDRPVHLDILLRVPNWAERACATSTSAAIEQKGQFIVVRKLWRTGDRITLTFEAKIRIARSVNQQVAFRYGPFLFAEPLASSKRSIKSYPMSGFEDFHLSPAGESGGGLPGSRELHQFGFKVVDLSHEGDPLRPFDKPLLALEGELYAGPESSPNRVQLVPLGNAPQLRRVTFPVLTSTLERKRMNPRKGLQIIDTEDS